MISLGMCEGFSLWKKNHDTFSKFKKFKETVEGKMGKKIGYFCTGNRGEYSLYESSQYP